MMMNILLGTTMYPVIFIMCILCKVIGSRKDKMIFGVHLGNELKTDERVSAATKKFNKETLWLTLAIAIVPISFFFTKHASVQFTLWMMWFLIALVVMMIPYIHANKTVMAIKREAKSKEMTGSTEVESNNVPEPAKTVRYVETNIVRTVKSAEFVPQMILSALAPISVFVIGKLIYPDSKDFAMLEVYLWSTLTIALITFLFYLIAVAMDRASSIVISNDSAVNTAYNRAKKSIWKKVWIGEAWLNTATVLVIAAGGLLQKHSFLIFMIAILAETVIGIAILLAAAKDINEVNKTYDPKKEETFKSDDDEYWTWGMFYNNPNDKRNYVEKRFGAGVTTNMASKTGKVTTVIAIAALAWIPFVCIWLILADFTPMHAYSEDKTVVCQHLKSDYKIPYDDIVEAELLTTLPSSRSKVSGTGTDEMEKGKYSCKEYGSYYAFILCENDLFIRIKTAERTYIISGFDDAETQSIYDEIIQ